MLWIEKGDTNLDNLDLGPNAVSVQNYFVDDHCTFCEAIAHALPKLHTYALSSSTIVTFISLLLPPEERAHQAPWIEAATKGSLHTISSSFEIVKAFCF